MRSIFSIEISRQVVIGTLILLFCSFLNSKVDSQDQDVESQIRDLVFLLDDSTSKSMRDKIATEIKSHGTAATKLLKNPPNGLRQQTLLLLAKITNDIEVIANQTSIQPTRISLKGDFKMSQALVELQKQTGINFQLTIATDKATNDVTKSIHLENVILWRAIDQVLDAFSLTIVDSDQVEASDSNQIKLKKCKADFKNRVENATYCGVVRGVIRSVKRLRSTKHPEVNLDKINVQFAWEPKLRPLKFKMDWADVSAVDDSGNQVAILSDEKQSFNLPRNKRQVELLIPLKPVDASVKQIKSLSGLFELSAATGSKSFEIKNLSIGIKPSTIHKANSTLFFESLVKKRLDYIVSVRYKVANASDAFESHNGWMFQNKVFIIDKNSKRVLPTQTLTTKQQSNEIGFAFSFHLPDGPQGCKFVYQAPTSIQTVPIKFDFRDVELPPSPKVKNL